MAERPGNRAGGRLGCAARELIVFGSILTLLANAAKAAAIALGWLKQRDDQATGAQLQAAQTTSDNLSVVQAELKASVDAPKTDQAVADRLDNGTF